MPEVLLRDVYGVGRDMPLNYVARKHVDDALIDSFGRDKHIVIYGSSKQGKTLLRKHCLRDDDYILIVCSNTFSMSELNGAILKQAGYRIEQSATKTVGNQYKYIVEFKGEGKVPFVAKAEGKASGEYDRTNQDQITTKRLEIDLNDVNDVILALKEISFRKFIVIEDFHYLPAETQRNFSFTLKAYHENSKITFMIIGVWREKNRIIYYNGDLTNRVVSIDADRWSHEQLAEVVQAGEALLNIHFHEDFTTKLYSFCVGSVALVQEACYRVCEMAEIYSTRETYTEVGEGIDIADLMTEVVNSQAGRYQSFLTNFAEGFQVTELQMYSWLVYAILKAKIGDLTVGLRRANIAGIIKSAHPEGKNLNEGNITQALQNVASLQAQKGIRPIIFDYDQTSRVLMVVDRSFIIWLAYQNTDALLVELGLAE